MHFVHKCRRCRAVLAQCWCAREDKVVSFFDPPPRHVCDTEAAAYADPGERPLPGDEGPAAKVEEALRSSIAKLEREVSLGHDVLTEYEGTIRQLQRRITDLEHAEITEDDETIRQLQRRITDLEHENGWLRRGTWTSSRSLSIGDRVRSQNNSLGVITGFLPLWEVRWEDDGQEENCEEKYLRKDDPDRTGWCHIGLSVKSKITPGLQGVIVDWRGGGGGPDSWLVRWQGYPQRPGWCREKDLTP